MQVDFYQLSRDPVTQVLPQIARRVADSGQRLLIVAADPGLRADISEGLWSAIPDSFLAHGDADDEDAPAQPILLSDSCDPLNGAAFIALADGLWRDEALGFTRAFLFFDGESIDGARASWRTLGQREDADCRYWAQSDGGKWKQMA